MKTLKTYRLSATTIARIQTIVNREHITATEVITKAINVYTAISNADYLGKGDEDMKACALFAYLVQ